MVKIQLRKNTGRYSLLTLVLSNAFTAAIILSFKSAGSMNDVLIDPTPPASANLRQQQQESNNDTSNVQVEWYQKPQPVITDWPRLERRLDVVPILEQLKLKRGIEVGVQKGLLARKTLLTWKSCEEYKLVDLWGRETNYDEPNARVKSEHDNYLQQTRRRVKGWSEKGVIEFFIMRSTDAAKKMKDGYFDYIYLDARHDYCAVKEDIEHYYPKLRPGGILGGHDYIDAQYAIDKLGKEEDWSKCEDGSNHPEAVKGAVDDFAKKHDLKIITSNEDFPSWFVQKPY